MGTASGLSFGSSNVDPSLDQLFSASRSAGAPKKLIQERSRKRAKLGGRNAKGAEETSSEVSQDPGSDSEAEHVSDEEMQDVDEDDVDLVLNDQAIDQLGERKKKRKHRQDRPELEEVYMAKLSRDQDARDRRSKKQRLERQEDENDGEADAAEDDGGDTSSEAPSNSDSADRVDASDDDDDYEIPKHEAQGSIQGAELDKAARTVFLGNVSSEAIRSKEATKKLMSYLSSFLSDITKEGSSMTHKVESFRFRSVAFSTTSIPRKAAFAKKELMDATTRSTNAYVVYTTALAAREAVKRLNGTVILDRHLRVDSVAHPSPQDHRRCVFVGNLGFVDDESLIQATEEAQQDAEGKSKTTQTNKPPSDIEEGLWRTLAKAGQVESVRVVRDKTTRVGKGIAYVQFKDQVAVEKALELDGKAFPPLLPRKLRVTRAKKPSKTAGAMERQKAQAIAAMKAANAAESKTYNPKTDTNMTTMTGRASKLLGRAGAAQAKRGPSKTANKIRRPESFVFEGYRATAANGKSTMNLKPVKSGKKKGGKPQSRSSKRGAAFKASKRDR